MAPSQFTASGNARRLFESFTERFQDYWNYFRINGQVLLFALWCRVTVPEKAKLLEPQRVFP